MTTRSIENSTLGFVSGRFCYRKNGEFWTDPGVARVLSGLNARCRRLVVSMSATDRPMDMLTSRATISGDVIDLPYIRSAAAGFFQVRRASAVIEEVENACDVLIVQLPFSPVIALRSPRRPRVYHVCADVAALVRSSGGFRGPRRIAAMGAAEFTSTVQRKLVGAPDARVVTNGAALYDVLDRPAGEAVVSTALSEEDLAGVKRSRPVGAPFRILFVGYLRPEKGLDLLLEAYDMVLARLPEAELVIIGNEPATSRAGSVVARVLEQEQRCRVIRKGHVPFGPRLFQEYADADVLVVPSRSEGTPRVLVEARAFGCPVVASRVGGIPSSVRDGVDGLMVDVGDTRELANAVLRIATDECLRESLIKNGFERAKTTTVERFVEILLRQVEILMKEEAWTGKGHCGPDSV